MILFGVALLISTSGCRSTNQSDVRAGQNTAAAGSSIAARAIAQSPAVIGRVYLANRKFSFMPPSGFIPMSTAEIKQRYPTANPPNYVFTNPDRSASIAISLTEQPLRRKQLPELPDLMRQYLEKTIPGIKWVQHDFIAINAASWVNLEAQSQNKQENLHSDMYLTAFDHRMLGINFSTDTQQYAAIKPAFTKSRDSIQIAPAAL
jgi:hypothetical protein